MTKRSLYGPPIIPKDVIAADVNGYTRGDGSPEKVVSKGVVLALARRHIEALEKREMSLEGEKEILMEKIQRLERVLARLGVDISSIGFEGY
jgi:hypothetical protein